MITNVRPRRDPDPVTYEVIWNGTHHGGDEDLLNRESRQPEKRPGHPHDRKTPRGEMITRLLTALPTSQAEAVDFLTLVRRTGCAAAHINGALYTLRQRGMLGSEPIPSVAYRTSRPPQRYWRTA